MSGRTFITATIALVCGLLLSVFSNPSLAGPGEADRRVATLLEAMGGRHVWANASSVFTMERARYPLYGDGVIATHWLDLESPGERVSLEGQHIDLEWAWRGDAGWIRRGQDIRDFDAAEIDERKAAWQGDLFRLLRRLALSDEDLRLEAIEPMGIRISDVGNKTVGELHLTRDGDLYRWKRLQPREATMIFGSHRNFGEIRFPDWGTVASGEWSAYFTQVFASPRPFEKHVSIRKPSPEWQGGALHPDNCER